jgi:hypothetical protein
MKSDINAATPHRKPKKHGRVERSASALGAWVAAGVLPAGEGGILPPGPSLGSPGEAQPQTNHFNDWHDHGLHRTHGKGKPAGGQFRGWLLSSHAKPIVFQTGGNG